MEDAGRGIRKTVASFQGPSDSTRPGVYCAGVLAVVERPIVPELLLSGSGLSTSAAE